MAKRVTRKSKSTPSSAMKLAHIGPDRHALLADGMKRALAGAALDRYEPRVSAALGFLRTLLETPEVVERSIAPDPDRCPNCDAATSSKQIFCSELCNQEAALVRYVRRVLCDGRIEDFDVLRDGIGTNVLMVRSGGYPTRARTVPAHVRALVIARDKGICQICGGPGTEIDHIASSSNDPQNLQLTCKTCNGDRVSVAAARVEDPEVIVAIEAQNSRLAQRIAAETPLRACDDEERWGTQWRGYKKLPKPPPSIPDLCEVTDCGDPPSVSDGYARRCYTCFHALCETHAYRIRTGPPGHRESDDYCPTHAKTAEETARYQDGLTIDTDGDWM